MISDCFNKNRTFVMGMSIIFIVLLHTHFHLPFVFHFLRRMGYVYVDLFMMLSGYGLYYSLTKNGSLKQFFKKRAIRILPTYYSLAIIYLVFKFITTRVLFTDVLGVLTTMSFWSGQEMVFSWFAQSLVAFYLASPLLVRAVNGMKNHWLLVLIAIIFILPFVTTPRLFLAIFRIPAFVCGMCFAKSIKFGGNEWMESKKTLIFIVGLFGFGLLCFFKFYFQELISSTFGKPYYLIFLPAVMFVPSLAILLSSICNRLSRVGGVINIICKLGNSTFEIYLFQSLLYMIVLYYIDNINWGNFEWFVIMILSIIGGNILHLIINSVTKKLNISRTN